MPKIVQYGEFDKPGLEGVADGLRHLHERYAGGKAEKVQPQDFGAASAALEFLTAEIQELKKGRKG